MNENKKSRLALIVGIALPIFMVIVIALIVYIPSVNIHPQYSFLYYFQDQAYPYYCPAQQYSVEHSTLVRSSLVVGQKNPIDTNPQIDCATIPLQKIYLYDTTKDSSTEISFADAKLLRLDDKVISADGLQVSVSYPNGDLFTGIFGGYRGYRFVIGNSKGSKELKGFVSDTYNNSYYNFKFIGWVLPR